MNSINKLEQATLGLISQREDMRRKLMAAGWPDELAESAWDDEVRKAIKAGLIGGPVEEGQNE